MTSGRPLLTSDFRRLWGAYAVSELGSAIGSGALPLVALLVLDVTAFQVALLAALSGLASALLALPLGVAIEFRHKRPVMVLADLTRFGALASVPAAAALGVLTYSHLCVVGVVQAVAAIAFGGASGAHLKNLVPAPLRLEATSRFETTFWVATSTGPALGGLLISWLGATASLVVDAFSFLISALGVRRLRSPEPPPPERTRTGTRTRDLSSGWRYIHGHPVLRHLFWNAMLFGGAIMMTSPLMAVLMLRDLGFAPWQYGLALGLPGIGGVLGALSTRRLTTKYGERRVLLGFGLLRTVWMPLIALAAPGPLGLVVIVVANSLLLFCAGVFNPSFATYRMAVTADSHLTRVLTSWSASSRTVQPLFMLAGGALAAATSPRTAILVAAALLVSSSALLPWRPPATRPARVGAEGIEPPTAGL